MQRTGLVACAASILAESRDVVATAVLHLSENPLVFLCPADAECDEARASVAIAR